MPLHCCCCYNYYYYYCHLKVRVAQDTTILVLSAGSCMLPNL